MVNVIVAVVFALDVAAKSVGLSGIDKVVPTTETSEDAPALSNAVTVIV